ncbi:hypothetical protein BTW10_05680 [Chromohalobacter japonicus]|uniref:DUF7305 domain-containing protein n=1 Tax=Chromohalobacter japonicus TaxID=223900 RepID=A0A1Q8TEU0_9GAMM|nr:hypothetical protein [Chromohalobacter japonicus]OLO12176.1 hypothetical protein BTW10_05680 [Chromohalobacter japonicus]
MKASKQAGFVLVVGMMLLTVASGAVISGMSVNKYQERQAGNYVRTNNYEAGADEAFRRFENYEEDSGSDDKTGWAKNIRALVGKRLGGSEKGTIIFPREDDENWLPSGEREKRARERNGEEEQDEDGGDEDIKYAFTRAGIKEVVKLEGDRVKVVFWGEKRLSGYDEKDASEDNNGRDVLQAVYSINNDEQPDGAYQNVLLGCEGVSLSGSAKIDSYDSRKGSYDAQLENGEKNSGGTQGVVSTNDNEDENGNVTLSGSSPIYGQVRAAGSVIASGSASIHGDVKANKEIVIDSWSSRIEGNATAPVVRTTANRDVSEQVGGTINNTSPHVGGAAASCDSFTKSEEATISDLIDALASYASSGSLSLGGGNQTYELTPDGLSNNNTVSDPKKDVTLDGIFPEPTNVLVLDSFSLDGSANFVVDGGDMTLYVKGDVDIGGGATFSVAEGSSLKIVTKGRFNLGSNLKVASDRPTDDGGNPILSLYSTYDDEDASGWNAGVNITGASAFKGTIFAPKSTVNVAGSGALYGAVKGRRVEVNGGAGIHYDEALMESTIDTDSGESGGGPWKLEGLSYSE